MYELRGKYATASIYASVVEDSVNSQVLDFCNSPAAENSNIVIMPDCHSGSGCVIGTTATVKNKVIPNTVGVDIGCGVSVVKIDKTNLDLEKLDKVIHDKIPAGQKVNKSPYKDSEKLKLEELKCLKEIDINRAHKSIGTLGGGNHFIEANKDKEGNIYICVHSGSRYLGKQCAEHYQRIAYKKLKEKNVNMNEEVIKEYKKMGKTAEIAYALKKLPKERLDYALAYLVGEDFEDYLHDMDIVQNYAKINRAVMLEKILYYMDLKMVEEFSSVHNYIDVKNKILRKGAISAAEGEKVIIPINMRDGSIIGIGKGNAAWNYSAPHGAGRIYSRGGARRNISLEEFQKAMEGIYSSCVQNSTIDEAPMAYKSIDAILPFLTESVEVKDIIKPIYNFKATN